MLSENSELFCFSNLKKEKSNKTNNPKLPSSHPLQKNKSLYYRDISMKLLLVLIKTDQYTFIFYTFIPLH